MEAMVEAMTTQELCNMGREQRRDAADGDEDTDRGDAEATTRLRDEMASARREQPRPTPPDLRLPDGSRLDPMAPPPASFARFDCYEGTALPVVTWYEAPDHGTRLTRGQVEALLLLVRAGEQQILNFQQEQDEIERLEGRA